MLIFDKQFRTEKKIISQLKKKTNKSKTIFLSIEGNTETYKLDTCDIALDAVAKTIKVYDKNGVEIVAMDCHFDQFNKWQKARNNWLSKLLKVARDRYVKAAEEKEKQKKLQEAKEGVEEEMRTKEQIKAQANAAVAVLKTIKEL